MQDIVSYAIRQEKQRLSNQIHKKIQPETRKELDGLLNMDDLFYKLTLIKKEQKNFTTTEIINTIKKKRMINSIFKESIDIISKLKISEQNVFYYADLAEFYTIQKLSRFKDRNQARLYLICYIYRRALILNDCLVSSFIYKLNKYKNDGERYQQSKIEDIVAEDKERKSQARKIMSININKSIPDNQIREKAFEIIPQSNYKSFLKDFYKPNLNRDFYRWEWYEQQSLTIKRNVRPIFKVLEFNCVDIKLHSAVTFFKRFLIEGGINFNDHLIDDIPLDFFPKSQRKYLLIKVNSASGKKLKLINSSRYEFMLYSYLIKGIENGTVFIRDTNNFRSLEDELINIDIWSQDKKEILAELNMPFLKQNINDLLSTIEISLERKYHEVNHRILKGKNTGLKAKYKNNGELVKWSIPYIKKDDDVNNPLFKKLPLCNIGDLMRFVEDQTSYLKSFTHIQPRYSKTVPNREAIHAVIVASAMGIEEDKMQAISDVNHEKYDNMKKNFVRQQTLSKASDVIINEIKKLSIFSEYNLSDYGVHASVDGQKFSTKYNTIKSRYSKKYFGLLKGVVLYSLNANHIPLSIKVIGANEHESHYLLDIIESNQSDIDITSISGDMHSINRVNFALLHLFGYRFMPRFTQLNNKVINNLVGFKELTKYDKLIIKPRDKVDKSLIIDEWDNILRILASLALKQTTQSQIVKKLSTYKKNPTLKALIEFDRIIMSHYILDYVDSKDIREVVQSSLCRGESYHQLTSAIAKTSGGKVLNGKNGVELSINAESIRLIATMVIFYNAQLLCQLYGHFLSKDKQKAKMLAQMSPVAWRHFSFLGQYEFCNEDKSINIHNVMKILFEIAENDISHPSE